MKKLILLTFSFAAAAVVGVSCLTKTPVVTKADDEVTIKPFAEYKFQDADNLGKDTSGNGFDLVTMKTSTKDEAIQQKEENSEKFLSLEADHSDSGALKGSGGAWLYAPELGNTNKDFSDLIQGSYTVSATIRSQYSFNEGNRYAITFGRYCSALQFTPWANGIEISYGNADLYNEDVSSGLELQKWLESCRYILPVPTEKDNDWVTISVVGNCDTGKIRVFLDGVYKVELSVPGGIAKLTNSKEDLEASSYTFAIGGQCDVRGGSIDPKINAICDYKNVSIYDCALSDENIAQIHNGQNAVISKQAETNRTYVTGISDVNPADYDLEITDVNTLNSVVSGELASKKVKATTSDGNSRSYPTFWYPTEDGKIKGKLMVDDAINVENKQASLDYKYVAKIDYNPEKVTLSEVKLDNQPYTLGDEVTLGRHSLKFIVTPKEGVSISAVTFNEMDWEPEDDDEVTEGSYLYIISFTKGAHISLTTTGGAEPSEEGEGGETTGGGTSESGCKGSLGACSALVAGFGLAASGLIFLKKKKD